MLPSVYPAPSGCLKRMPLYSAGLWLAVMYTPARYGLSPRLAYNRENFELGHVYEGDIDYSPFEETVRYEPTMSIGISCGI